jgi:NADH-quinone oxidoreductase subunit D
MTVGFENPAYVGEWIGIGVFDSRLQSLQAWDLCLDGEVIRDARVRVGYAHKGLEQIYAVSDWRQGTLISSRVDSESSVFYEWAYALAVENLFPISIEPRGASIRVILSELVRSASLLRSISKTLVCVGFYSAAQYPLRERELLLDLLELFTGSRFNHGAIIIGGTRVDVTDGVVERVIGLIATMRSRLTEYQSVFMDHRLLVDRLRGVGFIEESQLTGAGLFSSVPLFCGDTYDRLRHRFQGIVSSLNALSDLIENVPQGSHRRWMATEALSVPAGEAYAEVMGMRGKIGCYVVSTGAQTPLHVQWNVPMVGLMGLATQGVVGLTVEQAGWYLDSLQLSVSELDR